MSHLDSESHGRQLVLPPPTGTSRIPQVPTADSQHPEGRRSTNETHPRDHVTRAKRFSKSSNVSRRFLITLLADCHLHFTGVKLRLRGDKAPVSSGHKANYHH